MSETANVQAFRNAVKNAHKLGDADPLIKCETHGVEIRLSALSPMALLAAVAGLDTCPASKCILLG